MSKLADVLSGRREQLIQTWLAAVRQHLAPGGASRVELEEHLPVFLERLEAALRGESPRQTPGACAGASR